MRGPINGIAGLAEVVETEEVSTEEMKEYFKLIKDSGKGILDLTDDILDNGKDPDIFRSTYLNLQQLKEKLDKLYQLPAKSKQIDLYIDFDPEKNWKFFPKRKLLSILGNLISNSIKFTPIHGEIQVALDIKNSEQGKFIQTLITDTGKGFTANEIQEFYNNKLDCSIGSAGEKGFGLGLKLVNEMLNDLNGDMEISSTQDKGAKIEVRVPI